MGGNHGELGNPMEMEPAMGGDMAAPDFGGMMGLGAKGKRRKGALTRPGDNIRPSDVLMQLGWFLWSFSWLSTTNALRYLTLAVLSFAVASFGIELPPLALSLLALATGGVAAWFIQLRLTAIERPLLTGYVSVVGGVALVIDLALNYSGARFAAPYLAAIFNLNLNTFWLAASAIALTIFAELFMTAALLEKRKGH